MAQAQSRDEEIIMKRVVIIFMFAFVIEVNAQSDRFFEYRYEYRDSMNDEWTEMLLLPDTHGLDYNYPAEVPLETGVIILVGAGICYAFYKQCRLRNAECEKMAT